MLIRFKPFLEILEDKLPPGSLSVFGDFAPPP